MNSSLAFNVKSHQEQLPTSPKLQLSRIYVRFMFPQKDYGNIILTTCYLVTSLKQSQRGLN